MSKKMSLYGKCKLSLIKNVSDETLEEMISIIKPVINVQAQSGSTRFRIIETNNVDRDNIAYTWEPKLGDMVQIYADDGKDIISFHSCGYYGLFKPSLRETYSAINLFVENWKDCVRYVWLNSRGMDVSNIIDGGSYQICKCILFGEEEKDVIDSSFAEDAKTMNSHIIRVS